MSRTALAGVIVVSALFASVWSRPAAAQRSAEETCVLVLENVDRQGTRVETGGSINFFAGGNVRIRCRDQPIRMASDSLATYGGRVAEFIGSVRYQDTTVTMDADRGTYYKDGERWEARGHVVTRNLETGSTLTGPSLDYYRVVSGVRDTFEIVATGRPLIEYVVLDSAGVPGEPYLIEADRVRFRGNDLVWAAGRVTIDRSDFAARADSLYLNTGPAGEGTLVGSPILEGLGTDTFTLSGRRIDLDLDGQELTYVTAVEDAHAVTSDWDLVADTIGLDVNEARLEQTLAWGDSVRPHATSPRYAIRSDSLAIDTPDEQLREVRAFGAAWLGTAVDSLTGERDWLSGDTVLATFASRDSAGTERSALSRMEAYGSARAFHQVRNDSRPERPSLNYVRGNVIVVSLTPEEPDQPGEAERDVVERVDVYGEVYGAQLEPADPGGGP